MLYIFKVCGDFLQDLYCKRPNFFERLLAKSLKMTAPITGLTVHLKESITLTRAAMKSARYHANKCQSNNSTYKY